MRREPDLRVGPYELEYGQAGDRRVLRARSYHSRSKFRVTLTFPMPEEASDLEPLKSRLVRSVLERYRSGKPPRQTGL